MQLNELLAQVDALKVEIDKLRPLKPEIERRIMQKFRLDWNYHSNAIEGNLLTLGETRAFLLEGLTANGKPMKDHLDIRGHDDLITFLGLFIQRKDRITEAAIREMHKILLKEPYENDAMTANGRIVKKKVRLGVYKSEPNCVRMGSGQIHEFIQPQDVPDEMAKLVRQYNALETAGAHTVLNAAAFHHRFVSIHPFDDGNGRMARILMNLILMRAGFPPVVIKLRDREPYVAALRRADAGESTGLALFIAQNLLDAENLYLRGAKGESIEDADDVDKAVSLLKQELRTNPSPIDLTLDVQRQHLRDELFPLLNRLDGKFSQLDELFANSSVHCSSNWRVSGGGIGTLTESTQTPRSHLAGSLQGKIDRQCMFQQIQLHYHWDGFLKDGPNDFSINIGFLVKYDQRKMELSCGGINLRRQMVYKSWLSEDEIKKLVSDSTKYLLSEIEKNLSNKRNR